MVPSPPVWDVLYFFLFLFPLLLLHHLRYHIRYNLHSQLKSLFLTRVSLLLITLLSVSATCYFSFERCLYFSLELFQKRTVTGHYFFLFSYPLRWPWNVSGRSRQTTPTHSGFLLFAKFSCLSLGEQNLQSWFLAVLHDFCCLCSRQNKSFGGRK